MLTLRCAKKSRVLFSSSSPIFPINDALFFLCCSSISTATTKSSAAAATTTTTAIDSIIDSPRPYPFMHSHLRTPLVDKWQADEVAASFRDWFKSRGNLLLDRIFQILSSSSGGGGDTAGESDDMLRREAADAALSRLGLRLTESLVIQVLNYGHKDVLSCLKFFDWAGRQPGFSHTRATFTAIFKILSRAKLMSLMLDYLDNYSRHKEGRKVGYYNILVMGYAVAGKPEIALQVFGRMRFQGVDLDEFAFHVLLNALVEEGCFEVVEEIVRQIKLRGFENEVTHAITIKSFCKQKELEGAENYFRGLIENGNVPKSGHVVGALVDGLCKNNQFDKAGKLVDEFGELKAYDVWIRELVRARKLEGALEFLSKSNQELQVSYIPDVFRYNTLIWTLLRANRLIEVCDLLIEMKKNNVAPDEFTMDVVMCFFCKAGMGDVALDLYDSREEFGLSLSTMAFNFLINTLCGDGGFDDAYRVLKDSIEQGYFPGRKTFDILADALCKLDKVETMSKLVRVALDHNFPLSDVIYEKYISALCRTDKVEDAYLVHGHLNRLNRVTSRIAYFNLINGLSRRNKGDTAAKLLIEMQDNGHAPTRQLFRVVIQSLCDMEDPEKQFQRFLEMQLSRHWANPNNYNYFIHGAGVAKKPELARQVYEMMERGGIVPTLISDILMLQSYIKSEKISDARNFFYGLSKRRKLGRKLCNAMIVGLCKVNKLDIAEEVFLVVRKNGLIPSIECYESLIKLLCTHRKYDQVISLIDDFIGGGRQVSSFIGNILLLHALKGRELYNAWESLRNQHDETSCVWILAKLIDVFSEHIGETVNMEQLEEVIRNCFPPDLYTYNMILRKLSNSQMDDACKLFHKLSQKGYEPNQWTYETLVHGFRKHRMTTEARKCIKEMLNKGYDPSMAVKVLI